MEVYRTSIGTSAYILGDDGVYVGTVLATTHGLGSSVYVAKAVHRDDDLSIDNVLIAYGVEVNGDVKIYVTEPTPIRITIIKDL